MNESQKLNEILKLKKTEFLDPEDQSEWGFPCLNYVRTDTQPPGAHTYIHALTLSFFEVENVQLLQIFSEIHSCGQPCHSITHASSNWKQKSTPLLHRSDAAHGNVSALTGCAQRTLPPSLSLFWIDSPSGKCIEKKRGEICEESVFYCQSRHCFRFCDSKSQLLPQQSKYGVMRSPYTLPSLIPSIPPTHPLLSALHSKVRTALLFTVVVKLTLPVHHVRAPAMEFHLPLSFCLIDVIWEGKRKNERGRSFFHPYEG